ncbi:MAG: WecB/TagA/CpsF family glycosyltransferase [Ignavibacteriaceae bacterium]|nr:WecB/TagA/CpsF family glycosyltransferase [Ignavibacteriaceae bacterium]
MEILLYTLDDNPANSLLDRKHIILYGDFNVLNFLYENNIRLSKDIILYPDSSAVYFCTKFIAGKKLRKHISTDIQKGLLDNSNILSKKLFFFGDCNEVLNKLVLNIQNQYQNVKIAGYSEGYRYSSIEVIEKINEAKPDILFVGLGIGLQEKWIIENYQKVNVPLIISVGGWFQYLSGNKKRAPKILRDVHLEWVYKLFKEFDRVWKRYIIGVPKFFYRILTGKIVLQLKVLKSFENSNF